MQFTKVETPSHTLSQATVKGPLSPFVVTLGNWVQVAEKRPEILQYKLRLRKWQANRRAPEVFIFKLMILGF